jgi:hypothetical protein
MSSRTAAAIAFPALVLALGLTGCGGGSGSSTKKTSTVPERVVRQHWRAGLLRWHHATQKALNGISVIFSTEASLVELGRGRSKSSGSLDSYEIVLGRCSSTVRGLGPVPPGFELAGRYALEACSRLEKGERGLEALVVKLRHGDGLDTLDPLTGAGAELSMGQAELTTVVHALNRAPD